MAKTRMLKKSAHARKSRLQSGLMPVCSGVLTAAAFTVIAILLLAVMLRFGFLTDGAIPIANQVIKVTGIALAAYISVRGACTYPWFRGLLAGIIYIVFGIIVFSIIAGSLSLSVLNLADIAMGAVIGAVIGLIFGKKPAELK